MPPAQHGQRSRGGAIDLHPLHHGREPADPFGDLLGFRFVFRADDDRREPPERRHVRVPARLGLGRNEPLAIPAGERGDDRRVGLVGLDEHAPRLVPAPGPAGHLHDLLEGPLGRAQVAARQPEVGVDHSDQGQVRKVVALGHQLRADHDVDLARLHLRHEIRRPRRAPDGVGGDDRDPRVGQQRGDLVRDPLHSRSAGDQGIGLAALRTGLGRRHDMAAMMAGEAVQ